MPPTSAPKTRGFTLVELLVVIGIIALLISILLPSLSRARQSAQAIQCSSNLRQFGVADQMYMNDNRSWHAPCYWGASGSAYNRTWTGLTTVRRAMGWPILDPQDATYGGDTDWCYIPPEWYCPKALRGVTQYHYTKPPMNIWLAAIQYSYGMNVQGVDDGTGTAGSTTAPDELDAYDPADYPQCCMTARGTVGVDLDDAGTGTLDYESSTANYRLHFPSVVGSFHGFKSSQVRHPSEKLFIADALGFAVNENGAGLSLYPAQNYDTLNESIAAVATRTTAWRHLKKANVLFFDGHVEGLRHDQLTSIDPATGNTIGNDKLWKVGL